MDGLPENPVDWFRLEDPDEPFGVPFHPHPLHLVGIHTFPKTLLRRRIPKRILKKIPMRRSSRMRAYCSMPKRLMMMILQRMRETSPKRNLLPLPPPVSPLRPYYQSYLLRGKGPCMMRTLGTTISPIYHLDAVVRVSRPTSGLLGKRTRPSEPSWLTNLLSRRDAIDLPPRFKTKDKIRSLEQFMRGPRSTSLDHQVEILKEEEKENSDVRAQNYQIQIMESELAAQRNQLVIFAHEGRYILDLFVDFVLYVMTQFGSSCDDKFSEFRDFGQSIKNNIGFNKSGVANEFGKSGCIETKLRVHKKKCVFEDIPSFNLGIEDDIYTPLKVNTGVESYVSKNSVSVEISSASVKGNVIKSHDKSEKVKILENDMISSRPKRSQTLPLVLRSPFVVRVVEIDSNLTKEENIKYN
ncbi:unnamed protein product [Lactuca saligna]|uniref:Uncharacterized protein n=1 Tax=Lactuca saligna TaxID=75948 RepID=A0AA35Z2E9_LACSI|nr:unnamed protein product [Lactuca saligna]